MTDYEFHDAPAETLRMMDVFIFQEPDWKKPRLYSVHTYPSWGIVHNCVEFQATRVLANGDAGDIELFSFPKDHLFKTLRREEYQGDGTYRDRLRQVRAAALSG